MGWRFGTNSPGGVWAGSADHARNCAVLPLAGSWTLGGISGHLGDLDLFPAPPHAEVYRNYRRWAFESAALDLALRQAGTSLHEALGRTPAPVMLGDGGRLPVFLRSELMAWLRAGAPARSRWEHMKTHAMRAVG